MLPSISKIKSVHPGAVLARELKKRQWESKKFAKLLNEHPQTINAISNGRRGINPRLSIKLGKALGTSPEYFMLLQSYYDIKKVEEINLQNAPKPDLSKISNLLFWDTDIQKIDWQRQKRSVIERIFERGNSQEIKEIINFYGMETIREQLKNIKSFLPSFAENVKKYV